MRDLFHEWAQSTRQCAGGYSLASREKFRFLSADELDRLSWSQKKDYYRSLYETLRQKVDELEDIEREKETSSRGRPPKYPD